MTSREQFEAWLEREQGLHGEDIEWHPERNCYAKFGIHLAWCAWQASRAAIEGELLADKRRMDWLVSKAVNVRDPMVYGSHSMFWSQVITDEEDDYYETKLREQIDAAMGQEKQSTSLESGLKVKQ